MKISEEFVKEILKTEFGDRYQQIFDDNRLLQYLDKKIS